MSEYAIQPKEGKDVRFGKIKQIGIAVKDAAKKLFLRSQDVLSEERMGQKPKEEKPEEKKLSPFAKLVFAGALAAGCTYNYDTTNNYGEDGGQNQDTAGDVDTDTDSESDTGTEEEDAGSDAMEVKPFTNKEWTITLDGSGSTCTFAAYDGLEYKSSTDEFELEATPFGWGTEMTLRGSSFYSVGPGNSGAPGQGVNWDSTTCSLSSDGSSFIVFVNSSDNKKYLVVL